MLHLAKCRHIRRDFWQKLETLMDRLGIPHGNDTRFWIAGRCSHTKYADNEAAGILFLGWRCLYAETVRARIEDAELRLKHAYARTILMIISRLKAQGQKWYRWYSRTKGISSKKVKKFPKRYRNRKLMKTKEDASYDISPVLLREYDRVKTDRQ